MDIGVIPIKRKSKTPLIEGWKEKATCDVKIIRRWAKTWSYCNFGVVTGRSSKLLVLDVDGVEGQKAFEALKQKHGKLPRTLRVKTHRGFHLYFWTGKVRIHNSVGKLGDGLDVRGDGGYVVAPGSSHPNGSRYEFAEGCGIDEAGIADAPGWLVELVRRPPVPDNPPLGRKPTSPKARYRLKAYVIAIKEKELHRLKTAPEGQRNTTLNRCAFKIAQLVHHGFFEGGEAKARLRLIATQIGLEPQEIESSIKSGWTAGVSSPRDIAFNLKGSPAASPEEARPSPVDFNQKLATFGETDADNARRFIERYGGITLFTPGRGWLIYDGRAWVTDNLGKRNVLADKTMDLIVDEEKYLAGSAEKLARRGFATRSKSNGARDRMLESARHLLTVSDAIFDSDPYAVNVLNGTIDLKTAILHAHDSRDYITLLAPVSYDPDAPCRLFKKTLHRALKGNIKLKGYVQRAVGYSLTGNTTEQVCFFLHGPGKTSKSTIVNTIRGTLGKYGKHTPTETLLAKKFDSNISNDLARLKGARLVTAIEAHFNRDLDEAKIKAITGGEPITARFLFKEFFEFQPEFKLWLVSNDYPRVRDTSGAFWRRVRVIPFDVEIPDEDIDKELPEKLKKERPGILAWAVRGALRWQRMGLGSMKAIENATNKWRQALDHVERFVADYCVVKPKGSEMAQPVFDRYVQWCKMSGETPLSMAKFKARMKALKFHHKRTKRGSVWKGFTLKIMGTNFKP